MVWTLEPAAAAAAVETVAMLSERRAPDAARHLSELHRSMPLSPPPDGATITAVSRRVVDYLAARL